MAGDKIGLRLERLFGFRQVNRIPVGVRHCVEHDQLRVYARAQKCPMEVGGSAEQHIARAGHAKRGREALQIRINRRENGVLRVVVHDVRSDGGVGLVLKSSEAANAID